MIAIVIRRTVDYGNETAFNAQIPQNMRAGVALWNATFDMPYNLFRRELKRIAGINLSRVDNASCLPIEEVPNGVLTVPVDDDDWFAPDLGLALEAGVPDEYRGCYWDGRFLEVYTSVAHRFSLLLPRSLVIRLLAIRRVIFPGARPQWMCMTNNYAVRHGPDAVPLLLDHRRATYWFLAHPSSVLRLDRTLSLMNRSLASTTQLWSRPSRALLLSKFRRYRSLYAKPAPADLAWCEPYVAMMRDLMAAVKPRKM
jgi:hypothetical protein